MAIFRLTVLVHKNAGKHVSERDDTYIGSRLTCFQKINLKRKYCINPLSPELNPICYLLALLGAHHSLHVSRIRVKLLTLRRLMSYIYGAPILDVSRSHTTTQHSRQDSSGRVMSSSQRPLPDNKRHSQQTNIYAPGGIRTHDLSRRAAAGRSPANYFCELKFSGNTHQRPQQCLGV